MTLSLTAPEPKYGIFKKLQHMQNYFSLEYDFSWMPLVPCFQVVLY